MSFDDYANWFLSNLTYSESYPNFKPLEVNKDNYFLGGVKPIR
ncbi:MAG: hypothetical protein WCB31_08775 [Nitrososphaeraceae archaeon]